jgi:hypothetical protein
MYSWALIVSGLLNAFVISSAFVTPSNVVAALYLAHCELARGPVWILRGQDVRSSATHSNRLDHFRTRINVPVIFPICSRYLGGSSSYPSASISTPYEPLSQAAWNLASRRA